MKRVLRMLSPVVLSTTSHVYKYDRPCNVGQLPGPISSCQTKKKKYNGVILQHVVVTGMKANLLERLPSAVMDPSNPWPDPLQCVISH